MKYVIISEFEYNRFNCYNNKNKMEIVFQGNETINTAPSKQLLLGSIVH